MSAKSDTMQPANSTNNPQESKNAEPRRLGLQQVYPRPGDNSIKTEIEIVAIHGLDTHSPKTWVAWKDGDSTLEVHWLKDEEMLPSVIKNARISTYDWNANYDHDSPDDTLLGHADGLLESLRIQRSENESNDPIIFVASCFGGLLLIKALHRAQEVPEYKNMLTFTAGIAFLGTPFQGSHASFYDATQLRIAVAESMGGEVSNEMVKYLRNSDDGRRELDELVQRFRELIEQEAFKFPMICFYETRQTDFRKVMRNLPRAFVQELGGRESGILVPKHSASLQGLRQFSLTVRHAMLNKYGNPNDADFKKVASRIKILADDARKTLQGKGIVCLWESDDWILKHHYAEHKLKIERLSNKELPMGQCYINLAIIEQPFQDAAQSRKVSEYTQRSPFALTARLEVETPDKNVQIELVKIFDSRKRPDGNTIQPRRILIRGRAGVGKTTLCKKIVHDFINRHIWRDLFDRILWVPLRNLKQKPKEGFTLEGLFIRDFFYNTPKRQDLARELENALHNSKYARTLFVLDGLDEISEGLYQSSEVYLFLQFLLQRPNVIITCRPSVKLPNYLSFDLKLETIGFYPDQIIDYLKAAFEAPQKVEQISSSLRRHRLVHSLVRIPIQLDALCLIWDEEPDVKTDSLKTMTEIYKAIEQRLWKKDVQRLGKLKEEKVEKVGPKEMNRYINPITKLLECLAFNGMYHNLVEFEPEYRDVVLEHVNPQDDNFTLNELLEKVSFLRTSDPSIELTKRSYHFLHLTYQEYFAAKYFVWHWRTGEDIEYYLEDQESQTKTSAYDFLQEFKYTARYDIMWRFAAGLLGKEVPDFFKSIEEIPLDLIGPAHQRLVMHCLSETDPSAYLEARPNLESRLSQWLLFECDLTLESNLSQWLLYEYDLTGRSLLTSESEFPHTALHNALEESNRSQRLSIVRSLGYPGRYLSMETITYLEKLLTNTDAEVVFAAIGALRNQPDLPDQTVICLTSLLEHADTAVYRAAIEAIVNQSNLSEGAVTKLVDLIERDTNAKPLAVEALGGQLNLPEKAVSTLVRLIRNDATAKDPTATAKALENSLNLPEETTATLKALLSNVGSDTYNSVSGFAAGLLKEQTELSGEMITILATLVDFADNRTKRNAAIILARQSNLSIQVAEASVYLLQEIGLGENGEIALDALRNEASLPEPIITSLVQLLQNAHFIVRERAAKILAHQSKLTTKAVTTLRTLTENSNASIQYTAFMALNQQSNLPKQTIMVLIQLLKDGNLREHASRALSEQSNLGHFTASLIALLKDEDSRTREKAFEVLWAHSDLLEETNATLIQQLESRSFQSRGYAAEVLASQPNLSTKATEALIVLLKNGKGDTSGKAAAILAKQSRLPKGITTALVGVLKHVTFDTQDTIAWALGKKERLSQLDIEVLTQLLEKGHKKQKSAAASALISQFNLPERTIAALTTMLKSWDPHVRKRAAVTLGKQLNLSDEASTALVSLIKDLDPSVVHTIAEILKQKSNWSKNVVEALVPLLADADDIIQHDAARVLGMQLHLPKNIARSIVALLEDETRNAESTITRIVGNRPILIDKILESLDVLSDSESLVKGQFSLRTNGNKRLRISPPDGLPPVPTYMGNLYGAFLCRSFKEQFWLQVNPEDSTLSIHSPDSSRMACLHIGSSDEVLNWRKRWNPKGYRL
ncbi:ARM repeat-containing protein [Xylaria cubensis]|nr:ARM repeat-containing protein [Xylaria cubensis]